MITDGEQRKPSFATYPIHGAEEPRAGRRDDPLRGRPHAAASGADRRPVSLRDLRRDAISRARQKYATVPLKQAVISASALSLLYPQARHPRLLARGVPGRPRARGRDRHPPLPRRAARRVQIDFTEGRLAVKLDPSKGLLNSFVDLNNRVLDRFSAGGAAAHRRAHLPGRRPRLDAQRRRRLRRALPRALPAERRQLLRAARERDGPAARPEDPRRRTRPAAGASSSASPTRSTRASRRRRRSATAILEAAKFIDPPHLGTTDDCGFSPFGDDTSTSRDTAFAKIRARVEGNAAASKELGDLTAPA